MSTPINFKTKQLVQTVIQLFLKEEGYYVEKGNGKFVIRKNRQYLIQNNVSKRKRAVFNTDYVLFQVIRSHHRICE